MTNILDNRFNGFHINPNTIKRWEHILEKDIWFEIELEILRNQKVHQLIHSNEIYLHIFDQIQDLFQALTPAFYYQARILYLLFLD